MKFLVLGLLLFFPIAGSASSVLPACEAFALGIFPATERGALPNNLRIRLRGIQRDRKALAESEGRGDFAAIAPIVREEQMRYPGTIAPEPISLTLPSGLGPYFTWLSETAIADPPQGMRFSREWLDPPGSDGLSRILSVPFEPLAIYRAHIETRGPNRLIPEQALMRIWRDFDPSLSRLTRTSLNLMLSRYQLNVAADDLFSRVLEIPEPFSWRLVTDDINEGMERLRSLERLITVHFQHRFPEQAWLLLGQALDSPTPEVDAIFALLGQGQRADARELEQALTALATSLELSSSIRGVDLLQAIRVSNRVAARTYPEFLLMAFPEVAQAFGREGLLAEYRQAHRIIELGRALANNSVGRLAAIYLNELNLSY